MALLSQLVGREPHGREVSGGLSERQCGKLQDAGLPFHEVNFLENLNWRSLALSSYVKSWVKTFLQTDCSCSSGIILV